MDAIRKILVPTDFSAHAAEAFRVAHTVAQAVGADVILFHIARPPVVVSEGGPFLADPAKSEATDLWDRIRSSQPNDSNVRVHHEMIIAEGPSANQIFEILDKLGCDLIVMGTHGQSWLKQRFFGSVTEQVLRHARCPVMVVKVPVPAAEARAPTPAPVNHAKRAAMGAGAAKGTGAADAARSERSA
jgi:nucleotide-binding universal stress UspA family protein